MSQNDSCLTPATDSDSPLLIEEYHQLFRIIILHALEDAREAVLKKTSFVYMLIFRFLCLE